MPRAGLIWSIAVLLGGPAHGWQSGVLTSRDSPSAVFQEAIHWSEREYGIGVVEYEAMYSYSAQGVVLAKPDRNSDTVAVLNGAELCFVTPRDCVSSYDRMIEFDYEIPGFAILYLSPDSAWAQITLDPWDREDATLGWVQLTGDSTKAILWSELLPQQYNMFFLRPSEIRFYAQPDAMAPVDVVLETYESSPRLDYGMQPLSAQGRWLQVELYSPSRFCVWPEPDVQPDTVWIEYLTENHRPKVFYYTRGC